MQSSLALTALLMGLAGGPHCVAMCGAPCTAALRQGGGTAALFHAGRVAGYATLGAVAAGSMQALAWMSANSAAIRPVWTLMHVAALLLGLVLLVQARQPRWIERGAENLWRVVRHRTLGAASPLLLGLLWALLPCGLLYSALLVSALSGDALSGAGSMALFASGTLVSLLAGPWLWLRLADAGGGGAAGAASGGGGGAASFVSGRWGVRLAGLCLAGLSAFAIYMDLVHKVNPFCVT